MIVTKVGTPFAILPIVADWFWVFRLLQTRGGESVENQRIRRPLFLFFFEAGKKSAVRESVASTDKLPLLRLRPGGFRLPNLHSP